ncbi:MAG: acyl carrier protein [Alphaproteobacteria bacterium]|nr:acyl carrier protein [Alphaproteobacteria bacterium]
MVKLEHIREIVAVVLGLELASMDLAEDTPLLGAIPEFDSMAVVSVLTTIEDQYDIFVEDDEISAETFETLGSLHQFVIEKLAA